MISRRDLIKAGIFAILPAIEIREGVSMEMLQRFVCPHETYRYAMDSPFVENGNASATDSRAAIRVFDSMGLADESKPLKLPPLDNAYQQLWKPATSFRPIPMVTMDPDDELGCYHCNGYGFLGVLHECEKCYGSGEDFDASMMWNGKKCQKCYEGYRSDKPCPVCNGKPESSPGGTVQLTEHLKVNAAYFHLISQLPDARWSFGPGYEAEITYVSLGPVMLVEFQGGQAMVMGMR